MRARRLWLLEDRGDGDDSQQVWEMNAGISAPAAFNPTIVSATAAEYETAATSTVVTLPARNVGDRLLLLLNRSSSDGEAVATPSGWTALDTSSLTGTTSSFTRAYYQDVTSGNVGDTTATFVGASNVLAASLVWRLSGCDLTVAPVANGTRQNLTTETTVDPGALTGPNAGAVQRNLWFVYVGTAAQDTALGVTPVVTGFPATYGDTGTNTTHDATVALGSGQGWGSKVATAGSDNPSAWTYNPTNPTPNRALAINIAVRGVIG